MNTQPDKKLASAQSTQTATEKALLLAEAAAKRAHNAKIEYKLAKRTWKLARKAAKRTAKEARRWQEKLKAVASVLKKAKQRPAPKPVRPKARRAAPKPVPPGLSNKPIENGGASAESTAREAAN